MGHLDSGPRLAGPMLVGHSRYVRSGHQMIWNCKLVGSDLGYRQGVATCNPWYGYRPHEKSILMWGDWVLGRLSFDEHGNGVAYSGPPAPIEHLADK